MNIYFLHPWFILSMASSFSSMPTYSYHRLIGNGSSSSSWRSKVGVTKCKLNDDSSAEANLASNRVSKLEIGSPIIVTEAPQMVKTAASVPCLRINAGLVKPGDVGRIVSRKPKDVWAVRLSVGTYLIDGKYFKPLEIDE